MRTPLGSQHIMSQTTKDKPGINTRTRHSGCSPGFDWQADINRLMVKPKKPEGQYLLVNQSWGLSNQPEGKDSPTTATLNVNTMYLPSSLAGNWMDLGWSENPANGLLVLSPTVQITAYSISFWSTLILTSHWSSFSFSFSHRHTHSFCKLQISHQILLTDCGKEMSGLISERLLHPF